MKGTTNPTLTATGPTVPQLDLTKYGKSPFVVAAVQHLAKTAAALPAATYTGAQLDGYECANCGRDLAYADGQRAHTTPEGHQLNACAPQCAARCPYQWCTATGDHTMHASAYVEAPTVDGYGEHLLPANIMGEDGPNGFAPFVGFLDLDLTPDQTRARCAELRAHLDQVEALANALDGGHR